MSSPIRVLYVDDDPALLDIGKVFLERIGDFSVETVDSASTALKLLESEKFDVIVSDYQMPGMDGITFLIAVRTKFGTIPFILFTGKGREEVVIQAINNGVDFYLQKGGDPNAQFAELMLKIRQAVQRHKAETDLAKSEANLQAILASTDDIIALYDTEIRLLAYNRAAREIYRSIFGIDLRPGLYTLDLFPESMRGFWHASNERALAGESFSIGFNLPVNSGQERFFESSYNPIFKDGSVVGFSTFTRDITERRRAETELSASYDQIAAAEEELRGQFDMLVKNEKDLRESEERYRLISENTADVIWTLSYKTGKFTYVSPSVRKLRGYTPEEVMDQTMAEALTPDSMETVNRLILEGIAKRKPGDTSRYITTNLIDQTCKNGAVVSTEVVSTLVFDEQGKPVEIFGISRDITERKEAEEALKRQSATLSILNGIIFTANKADNLSELISSILEESLRLLDFDAGGVYMVDLASRTADVVQSKNLPPEFLVKIQTVPIDTSPYDTVFIRKEPIFTENYAKINPDLSKKFGFQSAAIIPLLAKGEAVGALNITSTRRYVISEQEKQTLISIGSELGSTLGRMIAEEDAKKASKNLETLFNSIDEMVFVLDMQGNILAVNETVKKRLLYTFEELSGMNVLVLHVPERRDEARHIVHGMIAGTIGSCPVPVVSKDGKRIEVETKVTRGWWNNQEVLIGVSRDITGRKQTEELMKESENKFSSVFYGSPVALTLVSAIDGTFVDVNETFVRSTGYTREEVIGKTSEALGIFADNNEREQLVVSLRDQRIVEDREIRIRIKTGEIRSCLFSTGIIMIGGKPHILSTIRDNQARKQAEDALRESEEKFRFLTENSPDHIIIQDRDLCYTYVLNPQLGLMPEDMLGKTDYDFLSKEDADKLTSIKRQVLETGKAVPYVTSLISQRGETDYFDGSYIPKYDKEGKIEGLMGYFRNITERVRTEQALRESEAKHRILIEESSDPLFMFTSNGRYTYANKALADAFGKPVAEIIGKRIRDFFPEEEADKRFAALSQVFRTGEKNIVEGPVPAADGERYYLTTITPVKSPSGDVLSAICTSIDITDRKRSEEALQQSEESYHGLFNTIQQAIYILDEEGKFIDVNEGAEKMYGYSREEFMGKTPEFISAPGKNDMAAVVVHLQKTHSGEPQQFEFWGRRKNHEIFPKDVRLYKGTYFGRDVIVAIGTDITERRNSEVAFHAMVTSMVGTTGMNSLRKITENISSWLGAECVMIGEVQPDGQTVKVLSMLLDGKEVPDYSYTLKGTPCDHVAEKGFCLYPDNAIQLFPESRDLVELNIKGYIGTPLRSFNGQVLGILCALFRNPVIKTPGMQEIMNIIAVKAAAEIEGMRMMAALRESEETLAQVMNGVPTLISYMDTELRFVLVNKAHRDWYGRTEAELIGTSLRDLLPGDVLLRALPYYQQVLSGQEVTFENPTRDKDGRERVLNVRLLPHIHDGQIVGFFAALEDITDRKLAEEKLRESEARYRSNIEQSLDGILISDEHGDISIWNNSMASITGIQQGEVIGHPIWEIMYRLVPDENKSPEIQKTIQDTLNNIFEQKMDWTGDSREQVIQCSDGTRKDVQESSFAIKVGKTLKFGASFRDITERRRAEEAVRQANKKLNLLSGITRHDINNQLSVLQGYLYILKNAHPDPAVDAYISKITTAAERISSMIRFTKEYEEIGINAPAWQDCRTLVDTAAKQAPLGKVIVKNDLPDGREVFADPLVVKVCYNLMDNAVRYGGKITTIRFFVQESGDDHLIVCEDDGEGIPAEDKQKIFERGYGKNTGLGLALSREILDITGITINETGEPGNGARFEMVVPKGMYR